ncbi:phage/plasmid primase, P4 family [Nonomuraea sp. NPDC026600]|uniref:DNA primase family protein n=1 Tax=Nonomuraea sp. NPDC026600 TaxID=3155363 RepID=UPI0033EE4F21
MTKSAQQILDEAGVPGGHKASSIIGEMHRGQLRMAERFAKLHAGRLMHAHSLGWHVWDSTRWVPDKDGAAMRAAAATVKAALSDIPSLENKEDRDDLYADIRKCESASALDGILRIAGSLKPITVSPDVLDAAPHLFNTPSGTLDLRTGEQRQHDPADMLTKVAGCDLDMDARSDLFDRFINEILPDDDGHAGLQVWVQRVFGYSMLGLVREHVLPIFTGTGQNGKSTLLEAMGKAFGDYAINAEPDLLVSRGESAHPTGLADLKGARLAVCSETDEGRSLASATMKRLTGGERLRARKMRKDFFEFDPSHVLILCTNHKPKVSGDDPAVWRRIRVVPFDVVVAKPDRRLPERLAEELPALLAWAYRGYRSYEEGGLALPSVIAERTNKYQIESDPLGRFLQDQTIQASHYHVGARHLFAAWSKWCIAAGEEAGPEVTFADSMAKRGHEKKRAASGQAYRGIALAAEK